MASVTARHLNFYFRINSDQSYKPGIYFFSFLAATRKLLRARASRFALLGFRNRKLRFQNLLVRVLAMEFRVVHRVQWQFHDRPSTHLGDHSVDCRFRFGTAVAACQLVCRFTYQKKP